MVMYVPAGRPPIEGSRATVLNSATDIFDPVFFNEATNARKAFRTSLVAPEFVIEPDSSMIISTSRPHALVRSGLSIGTVDSRGAALTGSGESTATKTNNAPRATEIREGRRRRITPSCPRGPACWTNRIFRIHLDRTDGVPKSLSVARSRREPLRLSSFAAVRSDGSSQSWLLPSTYGHVHQFPVAL